MTIHKDNLGFRKYIQIFVIAQGAEIKGQIAKRLNIKDLLQNLVERQIYNLKLLTCKARTVLDEIVVLRPSRLTVYLALERIFKRKLYVSWSVKRR
jgi:hypothetical protein